jgi:hypothetical protein
MAPKEIKTPTEVKADHHKRLIRQMVKDRKLVEKLLKGGSKK